MSFFLLKNKTETGRPAGSRLVFFLPLLVLSQSACAIFISRPIQLMSDTSAAIRAAKDVQADTLAPELYRQANEWFFKAKHEYKFKNFKVATDCAIKARRFAEQAEFQSLKNGGKLGDQAPPEPTMPPSAPSAPSSDSFPPPPPSQEGVPVERMERMEQNQQSQPPASTPGP